MKSFIQLIIVATLILLSGQFASAASGDPTNELQSLVAKVRTDIQSGKKTEAALADDLKQFDALLAEHKGEKTDGVAKILYMKAMLYAEVIGDSTKADALMKQLKADFGNTPFVAQLQEAETRQAEAKKIQDSLKTGATFPDFHETDVNGKPISISGYKGKVVLVDFWATWCGPCRGELPNVLAVYKKYHAKGFEIVGVSLDEDKATLQKFLQQNGMTWQQYFDGKGWENKLAVKYGIQSIPATFLLDGSGKIIGSDLRGPLLDSAVATALGK
ncbi:MAG TPA: redoxin domain-containing protein [Verrucomicrobiae bacterium]|nr:redoxin domain-containing protein [Verrucomicrobiae bacterium]